MRSVGECFSRFMMPLLLLFNLFLKDFSKLAFQYIMRFLFELKLLELIIDLAVLTERI